ncbi:MAG: helix-turn-helix domain-containing protein [Actinomycetota bacterium]
MGTTIVKTKAAGRPQRADDVDLLVVSRIRARRLMLGLSQHQLATAIGVTYQQAHKYECGLNRISAGRLHDIAEALGVAVGYFFEPLESGEMDGNIERQRMCLELARSFAGITNEKHQRALCVMAKALVPDND